jgi:hypothetical protein
MRPFKPRRVRKPRPSHTGQRYRRPEALLHLENLEDRCVPAGTVTITSFTVPQATEGQPSNPAIMATFTDTADLMANQLTAQVNYGDGTAVSMAMITKTGTGQYMVTDTHTFPEESGSTVPPFAFTATLTAFENANPMTNTDMKTAQAQVLDAALVPGNPVTAGTPQIITGGGTGQSTTAAVALANFEAAIGGVKNTAAAPQNGGFRTITWDGVKVDGTDNAAGPNSTIIITPNHTVGISLNRFQGQGVFFGAIYAVSNDGFTDVNPNVTGLFPAFSAPNTFAMFNDNGIDFKFVSPSGPGNALVSAQSRGFGAIFINVQQTNTTSITYLHGSQVLQTVFAPANTTAGSPVFVGALFNNPIVTNVLLTLGQGVIFKFDGTTVTPGGMNTATNNLVVTDDWAYAEPVPSPNGFPIVSGPSGTTNAPTTITASQNQPFTGVVATFSDMDPNGNAKDYTAVINWGDGHLSNGTIAKNNSGGFDVSGTNTYTRSGTFPISVDIMDFGGGPGAGGSMPTLSVTNTAKVNPRYFAVGGHPGMVQVLHLDGTLITQFLPFGSSYTGGVSVAVGDVSGDGIPDLVVGATNGNPQVKVYNGAAFFNGTFNVNNPDASLLTSFFPYALSFNVGANVAVGDVNGDGFADIVTGATVGNPDVRVYNGKDIAQGTFNATGSSLLAQFFPYAVQFNVGANVAVGDLEKNGFADIVTGPTAGNPDVRVYRGKDIANKMFNPTGSSLVAQFFAFGLQFNVGAFVAVADTSGDGFPDLIVGASNGNPQVKVYNGQAIAQGTFVNANPDASLLNQFFAFTMGGNGGVSVAAAEFDTSGKAEILTGATNTAHYRVVAGNATGMMPPAINNIDVVPVGFDPNQGVLVGA